jgi:hypothetical protein
MSADVRVLKSKKPASLCKPGSSILLSVSLVKRTIWAVAVALTPPSACTTPHFSRCEPRKTVEGPTSAGTQSWTGIESPLQLCVLAPLTQNQGPPGSGILVWTAASAFSSAFPANRLTRLQEIVSRARMAMRVSEARRHTWRTRNARLGLVSVINTISSSLTPSCRKRGRNPSIR